MKPSRRRPRRRCRITFRCLAATAALGLVSCTSGEQDTSGGPRVAMMPKLVGIPYFNACRRGAEEAARELGVALDYNGPDTADSNRQVEMVNAWVIRGYDVIAVAPNNPEAIAPVLRRAREQGVKVLTWDTDAAADARAYFCNQVDSEALARALVDIVAEETSGNGRVALVSGTETAANQNTWMRHMREYMAETYPGLEVLEPIEYPGEDSERSYNAAMGLLRRPEPPDAIVGMTSVSAPAAAKAVHDAGLAGKVCVTGVTLPSTMGQYVRNGTVKKFVLWSPVDLGYLTIHAARRLADEGAPLPASLDAGRLGGLEVRGSEILLGAPVVFDKDNMDDYDF